MRSIFSFSTFTASVVCVILVIMGKPLLADDSETPAITDFKPVILVTAKTNLTPAQENVLLQALSKAINTAALRSIASSVYGSGDQFKAGTNKSPVVRVLNGFTELDTAMDREIMVIQPQLQKLPANAQWKFNVQLVWHPDPDSLTAQRPLHPTPAFRDVMSIIKILYQDGRIPTGNNNGAAYIDLATTPIIDVTNDPATEAMASQQGRAVYEWFAMDTQEEWLPFYSRVAFALNKGAIDAMYTTHVKPATYSDIIEENYGGLFIDSVNYLPSHFGDNKQSVMQARLERRYGDNSKTDADHILLSFGLMSNEDIQSFATCDTTCTAMINKIPSIKSSLHLSHANPRRLYRLIDYALADKVDIFILLKEIAIGAADDGLLSVVAAHSTTPLVLRYKGRSGNRSHYLINQESSFFGFNIYERLVRYQVANGVTGDLRNVVAQLDKNANHSLGRAINDLLNSISSTTNQN